MSPICYQYMLYNLANLVQKLGRIRASRVDFSLPMGFILDIWIVIS